MKDQKQHERRQFPRFNINVPVTFSGFGNVQGNTIEATSINISLNGLYCKVNHYIPLLDRLRITLMLPEVSEEAENMVITLEGVVVRIEPEYEEEGRTEYYVALFFQNITPSQRKVFHALITQYAHKNGAYVELNA